MTTTPITASNTDQQIDITTGSELALAGQVANRIAAQRLFADYRSRRAVNTLRAQDGDLALFRDYLLSIQAPHAGDLAHVPDAWRGVSWGLVAGFVQWLLRGGYAVGTVNRALSTVKQYATLAFRAGALTAEEYALLKTVTGYSVKEGKKLDVQREAADLHVRRLIPGAKKVAHIHLDVEQVNLLKTDHPDTPQGRRDVLLMCLLLDHGLRCGEVAGLTVGAIQRKSGELRFYRPKVDKVQTHRLTAATRRALNAYIEAGDMPVMHDAPLLRGSRKNGQLTATGMSARAITARVRTLGAALGIEGLSAHDCRHSWATRASRSGTDPFALQEAGGWNSLAMPRRYVEAARIANDGVSV